jgi:hypothetical protein
MRKIDKMVSLNPEYGIEVSTLDALAEKIKDENYELYTILSILSASIIGDDLKKLEKYCTKYLEDKAYESKLKKSIIDMLSGDKNNDSNISSDWEL